jgi:hypothetical protein
MELEFDKEIDAILRKARGGTSAAAIAGPHIDADAIAAFAENALPERTRLLYTEHLADCGRCRKLLSQAILTSSTADATAADSISAPVIAAPWYSRLFRMPSLAVAMGALVLTFGGVLGYLVLQNRDAVTNGIVAQRSTSAPSAPERQVADQAIAANTNASANAATTTEQSPTLEESDGLNDTRKVTGPSPASDDSEQERAFTRNEAQKENQATDVTSGAPSPPAAAAPAKPEEKKGETATVSKMQAENLPARASKDDDKNKLLAGARTADESRARRDAPPPAAKSGPARSGPVQMQSNQVNTNVGEMAVTRVVSGKTFNNRDGAWYDSTYRGQATTNVRRGTDEFKKLDAGLRSIANNLGGVVLVVWKAKAYRIQ